MGSKLAAAKIAVWSGIEAVIADAARPGVLEAVARAVPGVGTRFRPRERRLPARKLWIAFAIGSSGTIEVDEGARHALIVGGRSLLPAGVVSTTGDYAIDDAVEIAGPGGKIFAKGLVRHSAAVVDDAGRVTAPNSCPTTCRQWSCTATTWSSSAELGVPRAGSVASSADSPEQCGSLPRGRFVLPSDDIDRPHVMQKPRR